MPLFVGMAGDSSETAERLTGLGLVTGTISIVLLIAWITLGVYLKRKDAADRSAVASSISKQMQVIENSMDTVANSADPLPKLNEVHEQIIALVDLAIMKDAWHERRDGMSAYESRAAEHVGAISGRYSHLWGDEILIQQSVPAPVVLDGDHDD